MNRTTGKCPFEVVYDKLPLTPLGLSLIPVSHQFSGDAEKRAKEIKKLHSQIQDRIMKQNVIKYKGRVNRRSRKVVYKESDLISLRLSKDRFPAGRHRKLQPRTNGSSRVLKRINNGYRIDLSREYNVLVTLASSICLRIFLRMTSG